MTLDPHTGFIFLITARYAITAAHDVSLTASDSLAVICFSFVALEGVFLPFYLELGGALWRSLDILPILIANDEPRNG